MLGNMWEARKGADCLALMSCEIFFARQKQQSLTQELQFHVLSLPCLTFVTGK